MSDETHNRMFGPLNFKNYHPDQLEDFDEIPCILCQDVFNLKLSFEIFLQHLFEVHKLVVEEVQNIYNLGRYTRYWKERFEKSHVESLVPTVTVESTGETYFLLSSLMKEDKELRLRLNLDKALHAQEKERTDLEFERQCLFCRLEFKGTRYDYISHLSEQHNLQLGNPQNLVFIDELVDKIETNLNNFHCIFCEKTFPDRSVLKEHMRKKLHKRVSPQNRAYDKFYMVNYLEDKNERQEKRTSHADIDDDLPIELGDQNSDTEYFDWQEGEDDINCLFCDHTEFNINSMCLHMHTSHRFNFAQVTAHLDFYQKVKLVNYIRRQVHANRCPVCDHRSESRQDLTVHLREMKHCCMPEAEKYEQPEYYFPTYENDSFLYFLEDLED